MSADQEADDRWTLPQQRSLPEIVAERVVEAIRAGDLKPGERIVENQLAKRLGVSRGPLREALKVLEANHLVENRRGRGRGTYVAEVSVDQIMHMVAMRAVLEGLAARLVAERRTPQILDALTALHGEIRRAATAGETSAWRDLDWRFHETVCALSGNEFLLRAWRSISDLVRLFLHGHPAFERNIQSVLDNHEKLLAALRLGDPDRAEQVFQSIILKSAYARLGTDVPPALKSLAVEPEVRSEERPASPAAALGKVTPGRKRSLRKVAGSRRTSSG